MQAGFRAVGGVGLLVLLFFVQKFKDALGCGSHALQHIRHLRQLLDGLGEVLDILDERLDIADGDAARRCKMLPTMATATYPRLPTKFMMGCIRPDKTGISTRIHTVCHWRR